VHDVTANLYLVFLRRRTIWLHFYALQIHVMQFQWPGILRPSFSVNPCQQTPTTSTLRSAIRKLPSQFR